MRQHLLFFLFLMALPLTGYSNALQLTNMSVDQAAGTVTFDVEWRNSWRVSTVPFNWDAAWVFVKFRQCGSSPTTQWTHGQVNTSVGAHSFGNLEPVLADGSGVGIDPAPENLGVMLRRSTVGVFPNAGATTITLALSNLPGTGTDIDIKVFGVEMVFIPQESFALGGDGGGRQEWRGPTGTTNISSENAVTLQDGSQTYNVPASYPKGFDAYHIMKYEISQGQYAAFMNTINATAQSAHYQGTNNRRHALTNTGAPPNSFVSNREDRANNYMGWRDISAYLDWAALRPMSELEYEKAGRGQGAVVVNEAAWGSTVLNNAQTISSTSPPEDGTEIIISPSNANVAYSNVSYSGGDGGRGPLRVGIFAQPTDSTREATGASYYGVMELSGNIYETVIPVSDNAMGVFQDVWGDGVLTSGGDHDVADWPGAGAFNTASDGNRWIGYRGGSYQSNDDRIRLADRYRVYWDPDRVDNRERGGRGVR